MSNKVRNTAGKFAAKGEIPRRIRSVNLTDATWAWLAAVAEAAGMSRNDYLEALAEGNPLTEVLGGGDPTLRQPTPIPKEPTALKKKKGFTPKFKVGDRVIVRPQCGEKTRSEKFDGAEGTVNSYLGGRWPECVVVFDKKKIGNDRGHTFSVSELDIIPG
ncbi:hypothetical protein QUA03_27505 [Microcoleus sp. S36b_A4]|uniref:hypothetical protein n=1 Tax=Microcoleus sp. S36b_A4 TaxID=3055420 RepID=UPI002FD541B5